MTSISGKKEKKRNTRKNFFKDTRNFRSITTLTFLPISKKKTTTLEIHERYKSEIMKGPPVQNINLNLQSGVAVSSGDFYLHRHCIFKTLDPKLGVVLILGSVQR